MPPYKSGSTSASRSVDQLISLRQPDGDASRVSHISGTAGNQMKGPVHVDLARRNQVSDRKHGRGQLDIDQTLLYHKRAGQNFLEGFGIESGTGRHTSGAAEEIFCSNPGSSTQLFEEATACLIRHRK